MNIQVVPVRADEKSFLKNLSRFYVYEFSRYMSSISVDDEGLVYSLENLDIYWERSDKHPFFIRVDGEIAGFALVQSETDQSPNYMDEFFVMRKFEGKGVGTLAAKRLFDMFPGRWKVTQIRKNYSAQAFWRGVIGAYTDEQFTEHYDGKRRSVQEFISAEKE